MSILDDFFLILKKIVCIFKQKISSYRTQSQQKENKKNRIHSEEELARAIKRGDDYIEIEGDLANKVIRIKGVGRVAWALCIAIIAAILYSVIGTTASGGAAAPITSAFIATSATAAVPILGLSATIAAVKIAIAAGGIGVLNKIRKYSAEKHGKIVVLRRKA